MSVTLKSANALRGEARLMLGGAELTVRPSFAALVVAEEELGPLFLLVEKAADGALTLAQIQRLLWHCLWERPEGWTRERFGEAMLDAGLAQVMPVLRQIFGQILQGR